MIHVRLARAAILVTAGLLLTNCGGGGGGGSPTAPPGTNPPPPPAPTPSTSVAVKNNLFTPGDVSVSRGATVTWTWDSCSDDGYGGPQTCVDHTVTFDDGVASGTKSSGAYARSFATAGTYPYHCVMHGAAMSGRVVVQ